MSLKVAIQMDPPEGLNYVTDSTYALAREAAARGHALWHYLPRDLALEGGLLTARARPMTIGAEAGREITLGAPEKLELASMDVVLMRQDPPFDMAYITATHLLEHLPATTLVVNDPAAVRNAPEKLLVMNFPELMAPTLITFDMGAILDFRARHGDIVIKPLYAFGGAGVFLLKEDDGNLESLLELFARTGREPVMVQRYIPEIREGDKRIILVEGKPVGALNRIPAPGIVRSNMRVGGKAYKTVLSARDQEICATIGPVLAERGLVLAGIDVIGGRLTEINVTCPTGLQVINRLEGLKLEATVWDAIDTRLALRRAA